MNLVALELHRSVRYVRRMRRYFYFVCLILLHTGAAHANEPAPLGMLPPHTTPQHYSIILTIDPSSARLRGEARIDLETKSARDALWLHGDGLNVTRVTVTTEQNETLTAAYEQVDKSGVARLQLPRVVEPQKLRVVFHYDTGFNDKLQGCYRVEERGTPYVFSQFEPIAARKCFPSFDEPRFKTRFDITLITPKNLIAIANTRAVETQPDEEGWVRTRFATTEPLPTYLLAFAVGPFDVVEGTAIPSSAVRQRSVPLRGIATRGNGSKLVYALKHTGALLATLENYFGIAYPYDKLDIIAVPDFASGAMENAGAITFRDWLLLLDHDRAPIEQKRGFASVMAHELAHQWFGNLVTMQWWDDLWLNEAFATWMAARAVQAWDASQGADIGLLDGVLRAMGEDSLVAARHIRQPIETTHDIHNAFDGITYQKGAGVLSMMERYVGAGPFRKAVQSYLQKHRYGSATTADFLDAVQNVSRTPQERTRVRGAFAGFLNQPGVPWLDMRVQCSGNKVNLRVRQGRYLPIGSKGETRRRYMIPTCVRFATHDKVSTQCFMMERTEQTVALQTNTCPTWVLPNADGAGYYRGLPNAEHLSKLVKSGALSTREQLALADSIVAAFAAGRLDIETTLQALEPFALSEERRLVQMPMQVLRFVDQHFDEATLPFVQAYTRGLFNPALGVRAPNAEDDTLRRRTILDFLATVGRDAQARTALREQGMAYLGIGRDKLLHTDAVDPNLLELALRVAVQDGEPSVFEAAERALPQAKGPEVRRALLRSLAWATQPALAARARELALSSKLRANEVLSVLAGQRQRDTRDDMWRFVEAQYSKLVPLLPHHAAGDLPVLTESFCTAQKRREVEAFFTPKVRELPGGPRNLQAALESIDLCVAKRVHHAKGVERVFSAKMAGFN